jgi:EF-hand domain pair
MSRTLFALLGPALAIAATAALATAPATTTPADPKAAISRADAQVQAQLLFERLDGNRDGKFDQADREVTRVSLFERLDTDHNGQLSKSEFLAFKSAEMVAECTWPAVAKAAEAAPGTRSSANGRRQMGMAIAHIADANRDGTVSRDEFVARMLAQFDQADANRDGKLLPQERVEAQATMCSRSR